MKKLSVFLASLMLWGCGDDLTPKEIAVMDAETGHVNDWHEYYLVNHTTETIQITPQMMPSDSPEIAMQCTGWDGSSNKPTTSSSSNSTGIMIGSTSQSAPAPLPPASQMIGRSYGGGGGAMKMYTIRGELFHNMEALGMGCVSKKDAKQKAIIAFVKAQ